VTWTQIRRGSGRGHDSAERFRHPPPGLDHGRDSGTAGSGVTVLGVAVSSAGGPGMALAGLDLVGEGDFQRCFDGDSGDDDGAFGADADAELDLHLAGCGDRAPAKS